LLVSELGGGQRVLVRVLGRPFLSLVPRILYTPGETEIPGDLDYNGELPHAIVDDSITIPQIEMNVIGDKKRGGEGILVARWTDRRGQLNEVDVKTGEDLKATIELNRPNSVAMCPF